MTLRIFIGYDDRERITYHVLSHSIQRRASIPISITPLNRATLTAVFDRPRGQYESTDFSISRFIVPYLCDFSGWSVFMDCDMLCLDDVAELARYATLMDKYSVSVRCVQHKAYEPKDQIKFLGEEQTRYERKNWSSVMLFNNALCTKLTPEYVNSAPGLVLHQFRWAEDHKIRGMPNRWNWLVGEPGYEKIPDKVSLLHFTRGSPCFKEHSEQPGADLWRAELAHMTQKDGAH